MANEVIIYNSGNDSDQYEDIDSVSNTQGDLSLGWYWDSGDSATRKARCAIRFPSFNIPKSGGVNYAGIYFWTKYHAEDFDFFDNMPSPSGTFNFTIWGINEDNTSSFGSNPFSRDKTSASNNSSNSDEPNKNTYREYTVTNAVNGVMSRGGWNQGNALGLLLEPYDSGVGKFATDGGDKLTFILVRKNAEPNFKPTPKTVAAPTFPAVDSYGVKISYPGYDVKTATENQTYFTTKKRTLKVVAQGKINTTGGVVYNIAHGQSVRPFAQAWFKSPVSNKRYKIPRFTPGEIQDPDADTTDGRLEVDGTNVKIMTTSNCEVYYYIYIDELAT